MKTAKELVREMGLAVQPPQGVAIVVTEEPGALPNWVAALMCGVSVRSPEVALTVVSVVLSKPPSTSLRPVGEGMAMAAIASEMKALDVRRT